MAFAEEIAEHMHVFSTTIGLRRRAAAAVSLAVVAGLAAGGCASGAQRTASCRAQRAATGRRAAAGPANARPGPPAPVGWRLPDGNLASTREITSATTSANVSTLGVAWTVPVQPGTGYVATPVITNGVVYTQDLRSGVIAIQLATGRVLWRRIYNSPDGGPNGVNVEGGTVYAATARSVVALSAATGRQLWIRTLVRNGHEEINMAPGYNHGTVYVSTSPVTTHNEYAGGGKAVLWALNAATGAPGMDLGRGAGPVGETGRQLRRRAVVPTVVRCPGEHLSGSGQPRPAGRGARLPVGDQPARPGPVHRLGGQAQPGRQADVVLPAHPA